MEKNMNVVIYGVQVRRLIDGPGPEGSLKHYAEMGITGVDTLESELKELSFDEYNKYITDAGMSYNAFVALSDIVTANGAEREKNYATVKGHIDELSRLGVPKIMLAPMVIPAESREEFHAMRERMVESFGAMVEYARGSGVQVTIENQSVPQRADSYIKDCKYILDQIPDLGFVFDTGNFYCVMDDVLAAWDVLGSRSVHCHAKDWEYDDYGRIIRSYLPPMSSAVMGQGLLPLDKLFAKMKADGYDGAINLEVNGRPYTTELLDKSAEYLLSICK